MLLLLYGHADMRGLCICDTAVPPRVLYDRVAGAETVRELVFVRQCWGRTYSTRCT